MWHQLHLRRSPVCRREHTGSSRPPGRGYCRWRVHFRGARLTVRHPMVRMHARGAREAGSNRAMNPLDWSLIAGPLPVILFVSAPLALAWLAAGRNGPRRSSLTRGACGDRAGGAASVRWVVVCVPLIVIVAGGVIALLTWLINHVWRPFPDLLPRTIVLWSWIALAGMVLACARQRLLRTWPRRAAAIAAGVLILAAAASQVNGYFQAYPSLRVALAPWLDPKPVFRG